MQRFLRRVAVIGGVRIPFCRSNTFYADLSNLEMMTGTLNALVDRYNLKGQHIDEVVGGAVVTHSKDFNLTREAVLGTRLAASTPGITIMQACGTSLQGALGSAAKIAAGEIDCAIAVGSDTTSDAPIVVSKKLAQRLTKASQQKTFLDKVKVFQNDFLDLLREQHPDVIQTLSTQITAEVEEQVKRLAQTVKQQKRYGSAS